MTDERPRRPRRTREDHERGLPGALIALVDLGWVLHRKRRGEPG
jgi:hypothetical protein